MKFKKLTYKNFQSTGNTPIEIDLSRSHSTLIGGLNGSGKSTVLEALVYVLTGKSMKKTTLARLVNATNKKNLLVTLDFEKNGNEYHIERGIKPNVFEIYRNGEMLNQDAAAKDLQEKLEFITGVDYNSLTQLIILNLERFKAFMEMTSQERRTIVEEILDISIFSEMTDLEKKDIKSLEQKVSSYENEIRILIGKEQSLNDVIKKANESNNDHLVNLEKRINEYLKLNDELEKQLVEVDEKLIEETQKTIAELKESRSNKNSELSLIMHEIKNAEKDENFYKQGTCPTCSHPFENKDEKLNELTDKIKGLIDSGNAITEDIESLNGQIDKYSEIVKIETDKKMSNLKIQNTISSQTEKATLLAVEYEKLSSKSDQDTDNLKKQIEEIGKQKNDLYDKMDTILENIKTHKIALEMLSDKGVKANIIKDYIDFINYRVNDYLSGMEFFLNINLDEGFNESFSGLKEGMVYADLSTGQKRRVNLAIWLALVEVSSLKNSVVSNALFLDEILENIDSEGIQLFMKLLKEKMPEKNIFVVTQRFEQFRDLFESEIYFKQVDGFTQKG